MTTAILPGTGRGTARFFSAWWRGTSTRASLPANPLHHLPEEANGPPPRSGEEQK